MNSLGTAVVEVTDGVPHLGAAYDRIVHDEQPLTLDEVLNRHQLHTGDEVAHALILRHEGAGPGGGVFDERPCKGHAGGRGKSDGVGSTGVGHARDMVDRLGLALCEIRTVLIPHFLDIDPLVGGGWVAEIGPKKCADAHFVAGLRHGLNAVRRHFHDFTGAELIVVGISDVVVGEGLEGGAVSPLLVADQHGGAAVPVAGCVNAVGGQYHDAKRAVHKALDVFNALHDVVLARDEGRHHFGGIDFAARQLKEMSAAAREHNGGKLLNIVDAADGRDGKGADCRADEHRLRLHVADAADAEVACKLYGVGFEFRAEGGVLNIMNGPLKAAVRVIDDHAAAAGAEMRMVIGSEKYVIYAVFLGSYAKISSHFAYLPYRSLRATST
ncbi:hypothetical protein SDC9_99459 [bioreactor metagenome]|uniref:Uncharacterized protein n=1 Tax=bioreactor metagenome TaxID=1076179 RepID=A0A645AIZ8_9ZZZZ